MKCRYQGIKLYASVIAMLFVAVSTAQILSMVLSNDTVVAYAYSNSQSQSLVNDCDAGESGGSPNCGINGQTIQADGTASAPIVSLSGEQGQGEQAPTQQGPRQELQVITIIGPQVTVPSEQSRVASATCPAGMLATGGGMASGAVLDNELNPGIFELGTPSNNPTTWELRYFNSGPRPVDIFAVVECASLVDVT